VTGNQTSVKRFATIIAAVFRKYEITGAVYQRGRAMR
jgi:hypothetical protein